MDNTTAFDYAMFCRAVVSWVYDGTPEYNVLRKDNGLCGNLHMWCCHHGKDEVALTRYQKQLFIFAGLHSSFPFNKTKAIFTSGDSFYQEFKKGTTYANPRRIAWLVKHCDVRNH